MTSTPKNPVRIGNAQAFWGDRADAAAEMLAREPELDYITLDYLAEVSMSILAMQRERDPLAGYARDFLEVIRSLAPYWAAGGKCRLITNAGGLNPRGCAEACRQVLADAGCRARKIGIVSGDDVLEIVRKSNDTVSHVRDRLVTANAYLGAEPIVLALADGADIVITGRVADPSLVVAPCIHHFGWSETAFNQLAGATVAGHLIECGTQVTGGISTDWLDIPDPAHIGFPIVEVSDDGSCIVTKPQGTAGRVNAMTVKEQLVYEIGDPGNYLSPDVAVSFLSLAVDDLGNDRVRVSGATGRPRPDTYKVSATYRDGFRAAGTLTIIGRDAESKARRCGELVLQRVREAGYELRDSIVECIGNNDECVLRIAVEADSRDPVERFSRELMPLITAGPQGTTGYAEGRPRVHPVFRYLPCLIPRSAVTPTIEYITTTATPAKTLGALFSRHLVLSLSKGDAKGGSAIAAERAQHTAKTGTLHDIAHARSGDKGASANIGVLARNNESWEFLQSWLTTDRVAAHFASPGIETIERYELPNLQALNFVIHGILKRNLRTDAQGKALGQSLLKMSIPT